MQRLNFAKKESIFTVYIILLVSSYSSGCNIILVVSGHSSGCNIILVVSGHSSGCNIVLAVSGHSSGCNIILAVSDCASGWSLLAVSGHTSGCSSVFKVCQFLSCVQTSFVVFIFVQVTFHTDPSLNTSTPAAIDGI